MTATQNELEASEFNDTAVIRKLVQETDKKTMNRPNSRGRKKKYNSPEERLEARRLQQKAYRERKKAQLLALSAKSTVEEPTQ